MRKSAWPRGVVAVSSAAAVVAGLVTGSTVSAAAAVPAWAPEQLSTLSSVTATDLNDNGVVIGYWSTAEVFFYGGPSITRAVKWTRGTMSTLPSLPGAAGSFPSAINDAGTAVGVSDLPVSSSSGSNVVTLWSGTGVTTTTPVIETYPQAPVDINDSGQVVGGWGQPSRAFWWSQGQFLDLGTFGGTSAAATSINDSGVIVGTVTDDSTGPAVDRVFVRAPSGSVQLIDLPSGLTKARVVTVNDAGQVVVTATTGSVGLGPQTVAFLWQANQTTPIAVSGCGSWTAANDLNSGGQVAGTCITTGGYLRAFVWKDGTSQILPVVGGITGAMAINDKSDVVGVSDIRPEEGYPMVWHWSGPAWGNVYTTPGYRMVNGREWNTTCGAYSSTATRCTATILATVVKKTTTGFVAVTDWAFNNLTYVDQAGPAWATNPLARTGSYTSGGRQWTTTCTPNVVVGPRTCRTSLWATVYGRTARAGGGYTYYAKKAWVFNNVVVLS